MSGVSDAQLAVLAEVAGQFVAPGGYTEIEGASQVGMNRRSLQKLLDDGHLTRTDTGDSDTCGGRYRLHLTSSGRAQLRSAIEHRRVPAQMFGRPLLEEATELIGAALVAVDHRRTARTWRKVVPL